MLRLAFIAFFIAMVLTTRSWAPLIRRLNQATHPAATAVTAFILLFILGRIIGGDVGEALAIASGITSFGGILAGSEA